ERERLVERAAALGERLHALERSLAEREGIPPAARELAEAGEVLAVAGLETEAGLERAVAAALTWRASGVSARSSRDGLALLERVRERGLGNLVVLVPPADAVERGAPPARGAVPLVERVRARPGGERALSLLEDTWLVDRAELLEARRGVVVTAEGHGFAPER